MIADSSPVVLTSVATESEAVLIVGALEAHGIMAMTVGGYTSDYKAVALGRVQILVASDQVEQAREALAEIRRQRTEIDWSQVDVGTDPDSVVESRVAEETEARTFRRDTPLAARGPVPLAQSHRGKKRTKLLSTICLLAAVLGAMALTQGVRSLAYPHRPNDETLTERQRQTVQEIKAVLAPWRPVQLGLLTLDMVKGAVLVVSSITAFRLHPFGRRLLVVALIFAILMDGLSLVWVVGTFAATFNINLHHIIGTNQALKFSASPTALGVALVFGISVSLAIMLFKIGLEAAACRYLRSTAIRDLYQDVKAG